jgi:hypothetical protein
MIDYTALIFMINKNGAWVDSLRHDTSPEGLLAAYQIIDQKIPISSKNSQSRSLEVLSQSKNCILLQTPC